MKHRIMAGGLWLVASVTLWREIIGQVNMSVYWMLFDVSETFRAETAFVTA